MRLGVIRYAIPGASVVLLTLLAALPWGLSSETRFLFPLLPYTAIHFWAVRRPTLMPEWLVFLAGLATDVLTHGPLGFWSLVFLLGLVLAHVFPTSWHGGGTVVRWLHFCVTLVLLAVAQWVIATAFFMSPIEWRPFASGALFAVLAYPVLALLLKPCDRLWPTSAHARFERGL